MLAHPTLDQLTALGLHGMAKGFSDLMAQPEARSLDHDEWLALLLEQQATLRRQKKFESRARAAKLRQSASIEDVDYRAARGLDRTLFLKSPAATGSAPSTICWSPGRAVSARVGSPAPSGKRPAERISPSPTSASRACSLPSPSHAPMAAT